MKITTVNTLDFDLLEIIKDKSNRVIDGVNHGRITYYDRIRDRYIKIFDEDYCRLSYFKNAIKCGYYDTLAPALSSVIFDNGNIIGYITNAGKVLNDLNLLKEYENKIIDVCDASGLFYYDLVPENVIQLPNGELSLIDLDGVYDISDYSLMNSHNAEIKPNTLKKYIQQKWSDKYMKPISFIIPSRTNLKYLKQAYNSIRQNLHPMHEICIADDASTDDTWKWLTEKVKTDVNLKLYKNEGPDRLGHTILYDTLVNEISTKDIICIFHADMYACKGLDDEFIKYLKPSVVVSGTRIEPPLHPDGPEKIIKDFGIEPEEFKESELNDFVENLKNQHRTKLTNGIFAPWAMYKDDFQSIHGHDPLYAPQSKEDSDIFNKMHLAGYDFIQTWNGFVYHMTCRGSRFADGAKRNPNGEVFMKNRETDEWLTQNKKSHRNFIRKWSSTVLHDAYLKPIVKNKYNIGLVISNANYELIEILEPFFATLYVDCDFKIYVDNEQPNTLYSMMDRVQNIDVTPHNDIVVEFDASKLTNELLNEFLIKLSDVIADSGEIGEFEYEIFKIKIKSVSSYQKDLLYYDNNIINKRAF
jgi:glycosyltransferase involved in cell wall biosynthesis